MHWKLGVALLGGLSLTAPATALAQTPEDALGNAWNSACLGAAPASELAQRCAEIFAGGAGSRQIAAAGNFLDELPGQGRASTREGGQRENEQRQKLSGNWSLFLSADIGRLDRKQGPNEAGFDGDTDAITLGVDWAPNPQWTLGLAFNHSEEELDFDLSDGSARGQYDGAIGYASWMPSEHLSLNGYYGQLNGSNRLHRAIDYTLLSGTHVQALATASPDSRRRISGLGLDWNLPQGAWQWQLGAGLDWTETRLEAYDESGGEGLALSVPTREIVSRRGRLDATLGRVVSQNWGVWQPQLRVGLRHEFANPARVLSVSFIGDGNDTPIAFETEDPDSNWGEWALGSVFVFTHGHSGFVQYSQRFGHAFLQERIFALGWRVELH